MAGIPSSSKAMPPKLESPSKKTLLFHIFKADDCELAYAAFDNHGNIYILKTTSEVTLPNGKLEPTKTYRIKGFQIDGNVVTLTKFTTISKFPMPFPDAKLSKEFKTRAEDLLKLHGGLSIANAKSTSTPAQQAVSVRGKVIRVGAPHQKGKSDPMQHIRIADKSGNMRVTLFGNRINKLTKGKT